jgi:2'-5' RNA ligase
MFCAIELPEALRLRLRDHIGQLREAVPQAHASWSRAENIHLTLKFFGEVKQARVPRISAAAQRATEKFGPFQVGVAGAGSFPKQSQPRVLWIGVEDPGGQLAALQQQFESEAAGEGFAREERAYRPHLTIARIRNPAGSRTLAEAHQQRGFKTETFVVSELVVFRSELSSQGSRYTAISRHQLSG